MTFDNTSTQINRPGLAGVTIRRLTDTVLSGAPHGALTLLNGHALERHGGWTAVGRALRLAGEQSETDLRDCQFGGGAPHPLTKQLTSDFNCSTLDRDNDLHIAAPDWESDDYDDFAPDELTSDLSPFGSASIPALARALAAENEMSGVLPVLLVEPAAARPYATILRRQRVIADPAGRAAALTATYEWLAADLAAFASARPNAATIVASDDRSPEWAALWKCAGAVLPVRSDHDADETGGMPQARRPGLRLVTSR